MNQYYTWPATAQGCCKTKGDTVNYQCAGISSGTLGKFPTHREFQIFLNYKIKLLWRLYEKNVFKETSQGRCKVRQAGSLWCKTQWGTHSCSTKLMWDKAGTRAPPSILYVRCPTCLTLVPALLRAHSKYSLFLPRKLQERYNLTE